jgi:N-acylneuraminate cytidylyltransferase
VHHLLPRQSQKRTDPWCAQALNIHVLRHPVANKNITICPSGDIPLIERTIGIQQATGIFARIVVSTHDREIADLAQAAGADVPFLRPAHLSDDYVGIAPVMAHAVEEIARAGTHAEQICCAYATAVLSTPADYHRAVTMLADTDADYVVTCAQYGYPIQRALHARHGGIEMAHPEHRLTRSQDLEPAFHDAGQFYLGTREAWLGQRPIFSVSSRMLVLPRHRVQDIDSLEDWKRAEILFRLLQEETENILGTISFLR